MKQVLRYKDFIESKILNEGIDFNKKTLEVSYNPSHEDNVDTSIENNPTYDINIIPNMVVWSIFKRKAGLRGDGNPLIYALKNENGWHFKTPMDKLKIEYQIDQIAIKFSKMFPNGVTIIVPSSNPLNDWIAKIITSKSKNAEIITGGICKITTEEAYDMAINEIDSKFRQLYNTPERFNNAYIQFCKYLDIMDKNYDYTFTRHVIKDNNMRNVLDKTFKLSKSYYAAEANKINGKNLLIIDDTISRGQSLNEIYNILKKSYSPKTITAITLLSKLYK